MAGGSFRKRFASRELICGSVQYFVAPQVEQRYSYFSDSWRETKLALRLHWEHGRDLGTREGIQMFRSATSDMVVRPQRATETRSLPMAKDDLSGEESTMNRMLKTG